MNSSILRDRRRLDKKKYGEIADFFASEKIIQEVLDPNSGTFGNNSSSSANNSGTWGIIQAVRQIIQSLRGIIQANEKYHSRYSCGRHQILLKGSNT